MVSTAISGIPELIEEGAGILVSPGDVAALAQAMLTLHRDVPLGQTLARRARHQVEQHFDADAEAGELVDLFQARVDPRTPRAPGVRLDAPVHWSRGTLEPEDPLRRRSLLLGVDPRGQGRRADRKDFQRWQAQAMSARGFIADRQCGCSCAPRDVLSGAPSEDARL